MPERAPLRIAVFGRGAWGGTLAQLWERQGHQVRSWSRRDGTAPAGLLQELDLAVVAVSMAGVEALAETLVPHWPAGLPLLSCTKGLDPERLTTASRIWRQQGLPAAAPALVLSGPNLAAELAQGLPAASVLACEDQAVAGALQRRLSGGNLRLYTNHDPLGTEVAGALKNVMALAAGLCDGLRLGANARASLLTRGLAEMGVVLEGLGGEPPTLYGLAGLGDLLATATSPLSRNYRCGLLLAEGMGIEAALTRIDATVEAPRTARAALALAVRHGWSLPICEQVVAVIEGRSAVETVARSLMERQLRPEALQERP
ncbi:NAD(P)H-dependent glycerol-3-phosphate dehydrogenase [Cyanobium sp. CH-040]|nr:NAD(P)H-dependent glycerol-3-phosphate dehydrogenase [Cyanobium sp. CH-040]